MSVQEQITRISGAKTSIAEAIAAKGVSVPTGTKIDGMAPLIGNIDVGEELDAELAEQDNLIAQIQTALEGKAAGSGSSGTAVETCTVTIEYDDSLTGDLYVAYSYFNNGSIDTNEIILENSTKQYTIENLVCNSIIYAQIPVRYLLSSSAIEGDASKLYTLHNNGYDTLIIKITEATETPLTILFYDDE